MLFGSKVKPNLFLDAKFILFDWIQRQIRFHTEFYLLVSFFQFVKGKIGFSLKSCRLVSLN